MQRSGHTRTVDDACSVYGNSLGLIKESEQCSAILKPSGRRSCERRRQSGCKRHETHLGRGGKKLTMQCIRCMAGVAGGAGDQKSRECDVRGVRRYPSTPPLLRVHDPTCAPAPPPCCL